MTIRDAKPKTPEDLVLLGQAGIPAEEIHSHVERLRGFRSSDDKDKVKKVLRFLVEEALAGRVPRAEDIARDGWPDEEFGPGDSNVRGVVGKLREFLKEHADAKPGEIRLVIPKGQYYVLTPRRTSATTEPRILARSDSRMAGIVEPADRTEVNQRVTVRGRIDTLHPDLRVWLVVGTPVGDHYPQCRVSRSHPEFEHEVRIGRVQWGADEGAEYVINLVAADADGDAAFYSYLKSGRDGFGPLLPTDSQVLDSKRVIRRDLRPEA